VHRGRRARAPAGKGDLRLDDRLDAGARQAPDPILQVVVEAPAVALPRDGDREADDVVARRLVGGRRREPGRAGGNAPEPVKFERQG